MNIKEDNRPYIDPYLKDMINKSFVIFDDYKEVEESLLYLNLKKM